MKLFRKGQAGQSLILLALGFIALTAFVGIVTDVSLLFVRYSTLRRAVDAAAVAAAGQMRRVPDPDGSSVINPVPLPGEDSGQSVSVASLNLAARQFIEVYGLEPSQVLAETCYAQQVNREPGTFRPQDRNLVPLYLYNAGGSKTGDNPAANAADRDRYEELCKENELKLVRVTAQIESPTVFLRLLGIPSLTLTESSISQTAVLDVVLILDVSESMAYETTYDDWEEATDLAGNHYSYRYVPPKVDAVQDYDDAWGYLRGHSMNDILALPNPLTGFPTYGVAPLSSSPPSVYLDANGKAQTGPSVSFLPADALTPAVETRPMCQVRLAPLTYYNIGGDMPAWLRTEYEDALGSSWVQQRFDRFAAGRFASFVPMYNSYACCNDPNGDYDFGDLVCQPFQEVRRATSGFLDRLDFIRGDRVAFVTFDHNAHIVDPDGRGPQSPMIETQNDLDINGDGTIDPAINDRHGAVEVLNSVIGVRSDGGWQTNAAGTRVEIFPSFYSDTGDDGDWDGLTDWDPVTRSWSAHPYDYYMTRPMNQIFVQPSISSCWLDQAILVQPVMLPDYVAGSIHQRQPGPVPWPLVTDAMSSPAWWWDTAAASNPLAAPFPDSAWVTRFWQQRPAARTVEYRSGCGGGNIGASLGAAQQALITDGRTEGAVWLMVLLSDGASGISDPIARSIDGDPLTADIHVPNIYNQVDGFSLPIPGEYGALGVCPYGTAADPGELLADPDDRFPFCSDLAPETRHFCSSAPLAPTRLELDHAECKPNGEAYNETLYDADDYAHDWADWIALADLPFDTARSGIERQDNEQLPIIFTIGVGLDYSPINPVKGVRVCGDNDWNCRTGERVCGDDADTDDPDDGNCRRDHQWQYGDYLGEQLLRYIADAGDNNRIDDDYWQCRLANRIPNDVIADSIDPADPDAIDAYVNAIPFPCPRKSGADVDWGVRGPCETATGNQNDWGIWSPLQPRQSCGNYFVAESSTELEQVFGVIASRMFTRLSQ